MSDALTIRDAGPDDLPALLALYAQLQPDDPPLSPKDGRRLLEQFGRYLGSTILLGSVGDTVVATCALVIIPNLTRGGAPYALIENVVTEADHRKRGYGAAILRHAMAEAWRHGCYKVMLMTGSKRPETLRFYESVGFEQSKTGFQARKVAKRAD